MPTSGNWLLLHRLVTTFLYTLLRLVFITVQRIYWHLNGTAQQMREARLPENYERSAQVLDVVYRHKFCQLQKTTVGNFLCTHNRFENPQYIIDNDNITLMTINEHDAVFCETEQKGMHLWRGEYSPFMRFAQAQLCHRLIIVPLSTFHRLSELIGDPKGELIFLFNTARCGGTLLTRVMECTGRCVAVSEPNPPNFVGTKYAKFGDSPEIRRLARDVIRWECRPYPTIQLPLLAYFIKLDPPTTVALPLFRSLFPACRCLFIYRDVIPVAKSGCRLSMVHPSLRLVFIFGKLSGHVIKNVLDFMGFDGSDFRVKIDNDLGFGVLLFALTTKRYLDFRRRGFEVSALRYEDLVARPLDMCRIIMEFCGLPVSLAELGVKALDVDSQRNSLSAKSNIGCYKEPEMTPQTKAKLNELLQQYETPLIGEPGIIEGTLMCS